MKKTQQIQSVTARTVTQTLMGARELVCRTNLARKRRDLTQRSGIQLRKQTVVFKRREGAKTAQWDVGTAKCKLARARFFQEIDVY